MQRERGGRDYSIYSGNPFEGFAGFGSHRSMMSSIFGGRDPFDDPFFTQPFSSIFRSSMFDSSAPPFGDSLQVSRSKAPIIEELKINDEGKEEQEEEANDTGAGNMKDKAQSGTQSSKNPLVEHPDDQAEGEKSTDLVHRSDYNREARAQPRTQSVSFRKVTYGGMNGTYYTATTSRRSGSDGVVLEESKQADRTTGQAAHRISRGIHDKGHSVTRKLNSDGNVDTMQTLHNLNEDELAGFEQAWKGNVGSHLPGWNGGFDSYGNAGASGSGRSGQASWGGWVLPFADRFGRTGRMGPDNEAKIPSSGGRPKKVVRINIE